MNIKITQIENVQDIKLSQKVNTFIKTYKQSLKELKKDVFEKETMENATNKAKKIKPRNLPNSIGGLEDDYSGNKAYKVKFYQEDIVKMSNMSLSEKQNYIAELIKSGKFIDEQN